MRKQKSILALILILAVSACAARKAHRESIGAPGFFTLEAQRIDGMVEDLSKYRGRVVLVVNTASRCGFTPQYRDLQRLYQMYKDQGLEVLGFPSNDFGGQEAASNQEIQNFCSVRFGVTFPLFAKAPVKGPAKQPVFRFLTEQGSENLRGEVTWNFEKFLIDREGRLRARFGPFVNPLHSSLQEAVKDLLEEKPDE